MNNLPPSPKGAFRIATYGIKLYKVQDPKSPLGDLGVVMAGGFRGRFAGGFMC